MSWGGVDGVARTGAFEAPAEAPRSNGDVGWGGRRRRGTSGGGGGTGRGARGTREEASPEAPSPQGKRKGSARAKPPHDLDGGRGRGAGDGRRGSPRRGGTEAEEPDAVPEYMNEADEEEAESLPEEGTGAKKVMLIDGLHSEENRVAIVAEGNLDYYEVENQRRKAFQGEIYKAKVVNIAHAIERRSSSSGRPPRLPAAERVLRRRPDGAPRDVE